MTDLATNVPAAAQTREVTIPANTAAIVQANIVISATGVVSGKSGNFAIYTYSWSLSAWSACSATICGTGTQTRTATCKRNDGADAAAALCKTAATTSQNCQASGPNCNVATQQGTCSLNKCTCNQGWTGVHCDMSSYTYAWSFSNWSTCSATVCGAGSQTRTATCKRSNGTDAAAALCTAPATTSQNCQATTANCNAAAQQGTCSLNKCTCNQGWTGAQCADAVVPKCNTTTCPTTHGKCDAESDTCVCNEPEKFYGADCKSSYTCDQTQCANGGSIALNAGSCAQQCTCVNQWEDAANVDATTLSPTNQGCTVCGLDCSQYGSPDATCDKCQCRTTYWSNSCTCRFLDWQHTFLANAGWSPNVTRFTTKAEFLAYSASADADEAIIAEVNAYFGRILTIYQTITGVHPLRLSIQHWTFSAENLKLSTRFYAPCTGDTTIPGFDAVEDVLMPGYTPIEEIFYHVNSILNSFSQFNAMRVDVAGISSLMSAPNADEQVTVDAGVGDKVIQHPSCQEADFPRGEFSCDMADNKAENNAAFGVSSSMFSAVMMSTIAAVVGVVAVWI